MCGCSKKKEEQEPLFNGRDYAAFLGRSDNDTTHFTKFDYVAFEFDEFTDSSIQRLNRKGVNTLAYLNVGSLENYRDYYDDFESYTFMTYEEWPDERWIDVSVPEWQNFVVNTLAKGFKDRQAFGVYLDNVDVYELAETAGKDSQEFLNGLKTIIKGVSELGLKVMINGGSMFLKYLDQTNDSLFYHIWGYHQEEVFTLITDYENDKFGLQTEYTKESYLAVAEMMKRREKEVFFLEYTVDDFLKEDIANYCNEHKYHYYFSNNVDLK